MSDLTIELDRNSARCRSGRAISGRVTRQNGEDGAVSEVKVGCRWRMQGNVQGEYPAEEVEGLGAFSIEPPPGPYSYEGEKLEVEWEVYAEATDEGSLLGSTLEAAEPFEWRAGRVDDYRPGAIPVEEATVQRWEPSGWLGVLRMGGWVLVAVCLSLFGLFAAVPIWRADGPTGPLGGVLVGVIVLLAFAIPSIGSAWRRWVAGQRVEAIEWGFDAEGLEAGERTEVEMTVRAADEDVTITAASVELQCYERHYRQYSSSSGNAKKTRIVREHPGELRTDLPVDIAAGRAGALTCRITPPDDAPGTVAMPTAFGDSWKEVGVFWQVCCHLELDDRLPLSWTQHVLVRPRSI